MSPQRRELSFKKIKEKAEKIIKADVLKLMSDPNFLDMKKENIITLDEEYKK